MARVHEVSNRFDHDFMQFTILRNGLKPRGHSSHTRPHVVLDKNVHETELQMIIHQLWPTRRLTKG